MKATTEITPDELAALLPNGGGRNLIDVRTPFEFAEVHAKGAALVSLPELTAERVKKACSAPDQPVYLFCKAGGRAAQAQQKLAAVGLSNTVVVCGGIDAWAARGLPVVRGEKRTISLERQVRIGAGSLVLLGSLLAVAISPLFLLLTGFVGAGLIFAGATDRCGMAYCLARMPWNKPQ